MLIYRKIKVWWERKRDFRWSKLRIGFWLVPFGLLVLLAVPRPTEVNIPAVIKVADFQNLFAPEAGQITRLDRKSTRLNSSHVRISYAVFCLKKKKKKNLPYLECEIRNWIHSYH